MLFRKRFEIKRVRRNGDYMIFDIEENRFLPETYDALADAEAECLRLNAADPPRFG